MYRWIEAKFQIYMELCLFNMGLRFKMRDDVQFKIQYSERFSEIEMPPPRLYLAGIVTIGVLGTRGRHLGQGLRDSAVPVPKIWDLDLF